MRTASILLLALVALPWVKEAKAQGNRVADDNIPRAVLTDPLEMTRDYSVRVFEHHFGFKEWEHRGDPESDIFVGPFGRFTVPFTARQGLGGFCLIMAALITLLVVMTLRWKRRQRTE